MRSLHLNLVVALLAFGIGVAISSAWSGFNSVDKRLAAAIRAVELENIEVVCKKKSLSSEKCKELKEYVYTEVFASRVATDIANANELCRERYLSEAQCVQRKEGAIRDIQENMLGKIDERK